MYNFGTAHTPRKSFGGTFCVADIQNDVAQCVTVGANFITLFAELLVHHSEGGVGVTLINTLIVGKYRITHESSVIVIVQPLNGAELLWGELPGRPGSW